MSKPRIDVIIVTPGHSMAAGYVKSLTQTMEALTQRGLTYKWITGYSSLVHHAREVAMSGDHTMNADDRGPLHDAYDYGKLFWIDSDIEWTPADFLKLYDTDLDIVAGVYLIHTGLVSIIHTDRNPNGIPKDEILKMKKVTTANYAGFGFLCVRSGVFEKIQRPWFTMLNQKISNSRGEELITTIGEDVSWCFRAKQAGYEIHFDPTVLVGHIKTKTLGWK